MEQLYASRLRPVCPATASGGAIHHDGKAKRHRKYNFSDQADQLIREVYLSRCDAKRTSSIQVLAKKIGMPHWALKKRARELGLARAKELPWSEPELAILARYAWMSDERIRLKLKAAVYGRTVTGIHLKLKRMRFKHDGSFYSAYSLAQALGIDPHAVTRWIKSGHPKAKPEAQDAHRSRTGTAGRISTYASNDTDLVIDINGYFAAPGQGGGQSLYPVVPCRVLDTRTTSGGNGPFNGSLNPPVDPVSSPCAVPNSAQAYVFNATVVPTGVLGYLTLWPDGKNQPLVSTQISGRAVPARSNDRTGLPAFVGASRVRQDQYLSNLWRAAIRRCRVLSSHS